MIARGHALRRRERERSTRSMCPIAADRGIAIIPPSSYSDRYAKTWSLTVFLAWSGACISIAGQPDWRPGVSERFAIIGAVSYFPRKATAPWMFPALPPFVGIATG
jgi:hypothetical protein